ncbi:hypothetical protein [Amnibacterium kyonggiense]
MGGPGAATEERVAELRLRLYRPDPPRGAVDAYLDALAALPPAAPAPPPRPRARRSRPPLRLAAALVALAVLACAGTGVALAAAGRTAHVAARPGAADGGTTVPVPSAVGTPLGVLSGTRTGSARFDGVGHRVVVSVNCRGDGTIALRIAHDQPFVLTCGNGGPALAVLPSNEALDGFTVSVRPDEPMPWALAVGALPGP